MTPEFYDSQGITSIPVPPVRPTTPDQWIDWVTCPQMRAFTREAGRGAAVLAKQGTELALTYAALLVNTVCRCSDKLCMSEFGQELLDKEVIFVAALFEGACREMNENPDTAITDGDFWKDFFLGIFVNWGVAAIMVELKKDIPIGVQLPGARPFL